MSQKSKDNFAALIGEISPMKKVDTAPSFGRRPIRYKRKQILRDRDGMRYREDAQLSHNFDNIDPRLFRQLRNNQVHYSNHIDLHGMYVRDAVNYLRDIIEMRRNRHLTCWQVVHGKGRRSPHYDKAPLKHAVLELLLNHPAIAAISTIVDSDGASGAVAIVLQPRFD